MPVFKQLEQKAPDFSRHPNVGPEQVISSQTLFKAQDTFDQAYAEELEKEEADPWVNLYCKVGTFYGWSWKQFYYETPYRVIKILNAKIDRKLEKIDESSTWLNYRMLETALAISRCFGGGDDSD